MADSDENENSPNADDESTTGQPLTKAQRAARRALIAQLDAAGCTQEEIAERVGCSQSTVSRELAAIVAKLDEAAALSKAKGRGREVARFDYIYRESMRGWERSREPFERVEKETRDAQPKKAKGGLTEVGTELRRAKLTTQKRRDGNPRFLDTALRALSARCDLLGLYPPKDLALTGGEHPFIVAVPVKLSKEEWEKKADESQREHEKHTGVSGDGDASGGDTETE